MQEYIRVDPSVMAAVLDHFQGMRDRARGWLYGARKQHGFHITNFIPDTDKIPSPYEPKKSLDEYKKRMEDVLEAFARYYPHDGILVGYYAVGDGKPIPFQVINERNEQELLFMNYADWHNQPISLMAANTKMASLDIRVDVNAPSLTITGRINVREKGLGGAPHIVSVDVPVRIQPDSTIAATIVDTAVRLLHDDSPISGRDPILSIDHVLSETRAESIRAAIEDSARKLAEAVTRPTPKVRDAYERLLKEREAAHVEKGKHINEEKVNNALMIKYAAMLLRQQVVAIEAQLAATGSTRKSKGSQQASSGVGLRSNA